MNFFQPDLTVEVTSACNRACSGCYAPNVVTNGDAKALFKDRPQLFLSIVDFNSALGEISSIQNETSIRGGEPSIHPQLGTILIMAKRHSHEVYLETHGRWLLPENITGYKALVDVCRENKIIVKISFDKMHGLSKEQLHRITQFLDWNLIDYRIAITEENLAEYTISRNLCGWIPNEKIIFQPKAMNADKLMKPTMGVISVAGKFNQTLNTKFGKESLRMAL